MLQLRFDSDKHTHKKNTKLMDMCRGLCHQRNKFDVNSHFAWTLAAAESSFHWWIVPIKSWQFANRNYLLDMTSVLMFLFFFLHLLWLEKINEETVSSDRAATSEGWHQNETVPIDPHVKMTNFTAEVNMFKAQCLVSTTNLLRHDNYIADSFLNNPLI